MLLTNPFLRRSIKRNILIVVVSAIFCMVVLFFVLPSLLLNDKFLTDGFRTMLQKGLKESGLTVEIGNIHWESWNGLVGTRMLFRERNSKEIIIQAEQVHLRFNPFILITNFKNPEACLQKMVFMKPQLAIERYSDNTWNLQRYFKGGGRRLFLAGLLQLKEGQVSFRDYEYGNYILNKINGKVNFNKYPAVSWSLAGTSHLGSELNWSSRGEIRIDQQAGFVNLAVKNGLLARVKPFIPPVFDYRISSGYTDLQLNFVLARGYFGVAKVNATIRDAVVSISPLPKMIRIKYLKGEVSPDMIRVGKGDLLYDQTAIDLSGKIDLRSTKIDASIAAARINPEDWLPFLKVPANLKISGRAGLQLQIDGEIDAPRVNGRIDLDKISVPIQNEHQIQQVSGRIMIVNNNLKIQRLRGSWNQCPLEISGQITDILNPKLNLSIAAYHFRLQDINLFRNFNLGLETNDESALHANISGSIQSPEIAATVTFKQLMYQEVPVSDIELRFVWSTAKNTVQIRNLSGYVWEGELAIKGLVKFEPSGVRWRASGKVSSLDLGKISLGPDLPIQGKVSTDVVFRGNWKNGQPFKIGNVLGTFTGTRLTLSDAIVDQAEGVFNWSDDNLIIDSIQAQIKQGRIFGSLSMDNQGQLAVNLNAENIRMRDLLPDAKKFPLDGTFKGGFVFQGPLNQLSGKIDGSFTGMTLNSKLIGDITGSLIYGNNQISISNLLLTSDLGNFSMQGNVNLAAEPNIDINIISANTDLKGLIKWLPVDPSLTIDGYGEIDLNINGSIENPEFSGRIHLMDPALETVKMKEGFIEFQGNLTEITLTRCLLQNNNSTLEFTGKVNRDRIDLNISGQDFDLSVLGAEAQGHRLQGLVNFTGRLSGAVSNPKLTATISGGELSFGSLSYRSLQARVSWNSGGLTIDSAELRQGDSSVSFNGRVIFSKTVECQLEGRVTSLEINKLRQFVKIPTQLKIGGTLSGTVNINGPINNPALKITGDLSGTLNDTSLFGDFELNYSNNKIIFDRVELYHGNGAIIGQGSWQNQHSLNARVQLINFPLQTVNQFTNPSVRLSGVINSKITLEWDRDKVAGDCHAEITTIGLNGNTFGNMQLTGIFTEGGLHVKDLSLAGKEGTINGSAYIPWSATIPAQLKLPALNNQTSDQMESNFTFKNLPVSLVNNYIPGFSATYGSLDGNIQVNGELSMPSISGMLEINNTRATIDEVPLPIDNFQAVVEINNNQIEIKKARGLYGTGNFTVTGKASFYEFKNLEFDINLTGSRIYYKNLFFDGFGDLNLKLTGTPDDSLISGDISVSNAKIGVLGMGAGKNSDIAWQPRFDVKIKAEHNTRCRVIGFADLIIKGAVNLKGTLMEPLLEGEINSNSGVLTFYNNTFRIKKGKAVFRYSQGYNPYLEIESSIKRAQTEINLNVKGLAPDGMNISLTSRPFMTQADIFELLNWTDLEAGQPINPQDIINQNLSMVTDTIFGDFLYELRQSLNINYLYLEPDQAQNDFRINLGSYLTQQLSYSYSRSIFPENEKSWIFSLSYYFDPVWSLEYNYSPLDGTVWRLRYQIQL